VHVARTNHIDQRSNHHQRVCARASCRILRKMIGRQSIDHNQLPSRKAEYYSRHLSSFSIISQSNSILSSRHLRQLPVLPLQLSSLDGPTWQRQYISPTPLQLENTSNDIVTELNRINKFSKYPLVSCSCIID